MSLLCTKSPFAFNKIKSPPVPTGLCDLAPAHFSNVILSPVFIPPNAHSALFGFKDTHIFFRALSFPFPSWSLFWTTLCLLSKMACLLLSFYLIALFSDFQSVISLLVDCLCPSLEFRFLLDSSRAGVLPRIIPGTKEALN